MQQKMNAKCRCIGLKSLQDHKQQIISCDLQTCSFATIDENFLHCLLQP